MTEPVQPVMVDAEHGFHKIFRQRSGSTSLRKGSTHKFKAQFRTGCTRAGTLQSELYVWICFFLRGCTDVLIMIGLIMVDNGK